MATTILLFAYVLIVLHFANAPCRKTQNKTVKTGFFKNFCRLVPLLISNSSFVFDLRNRVHLQQQKQ